MKLRYTTILHSKREELKLTLSEYCVADSVYKLSRKGWCESQIESISAFSNLSIRQTLRILKVLEEKKLVERKKNSKQFKFVRTTRFWDDEIELDGESKTDVASDSNALKTDVTSVLGKSLYIYNNKETDSNNNTNKERIKSSSDEKTQEFDYKKYLKEMRQDTRRHIQLIARFLRRKKIEFDSKEKVQAAIQRHLRAARKLAPFSDYEIRKAVEICEEKYSDIDWTLDTLLKVLTSRNMNDTETDNKYKTI